MKKVIIIGAGITGLSAGINALLKGHDVSIYEKNNFVGGCCNGWYRDNVYIDNCMHWLTGTNQHTKLFKLWKKIGAIDETSNLYQSKYFYKSELNGESISLLCNTEKTRNDMIKLSPEDRKEIDKFINTVNFLIVTNKSNNFLKNICANTYSYTKCFFKYHKLSLYDLAKKFKHPLLKRMFTDYLPGSYSSLCLLYAYATFASGNGKIYKNGSKEFSENIRNKFLDLGGNLYLEHNVSKINIENNKFASIIVNDKCVKGEILISCIDPYYLFNNLLNENYIPKKLSEKKLNKNNYSTISSYHCAFLTNKDSLKFKDSIIFEIPNIQVGLKQINRLLIKDYSYLYPNSDKTVIQAFIIQDTEDYEYWCHIYNNNKSEYNSIKQNIAYKIMDTLISKDKNLKDNIKLLDSWTPITYNNYFNTYYGSYMGFVLKKKMNINKLSPKIKDLKNIYYLSYWQNSIGGLPVAAKLGNSIKKYL